MSIIENDSWNKILKNNLPPKFVVKIHNGRGYGVFDFDGKNRGFSVESYENGELIKQVETLTKQNTNPKHGEPRKETILVQSGEIGRGNVEEYESFGDLVPLRTYEREYDDFAGGTHTYPNGFALVDKNLNVVYKSKEKDRVYTCKIREASDILALVCKQGPSAMAFMDERNLADDKFKEALTKSFELRKKTLNNSGRTEQVEQEQKLFDKMLEILQKEFNEQMETNSMYSMSLN